LGSAVFSGNRILPSCVLAQCCPALRDRPFLSDRYFFVTVRPPEECAKVVETDFHNNQGQRNEPRTSKTEVRATRWQMRRFFASLRMTQETSSAQSYPAPSGITARHPLQADLHPHPRSRTGGTCIQPQRGGLAKPRPTAWVRKVTAFLVVKPRKGFRKAGWPRAAALGDQRQ
jgi:hypothetical protein